MSFAFYTVIKHYMENGKKTEYLLTSVLLQWLLQTLVRLDAILNLTLMKMKL